MDSPERPVAVVTGAAGAIGGALMRRLAAQSGFHVVGVDLAGRTVSGESRTHQDQTVLACDITDEAQVAETFATIGSRWGRIDLLVNCAGISAIGSFSDHDIGVWRRVMEVNFFGAVLCTRAALSLLRASRGRVVVISSVAGFAPVVGRPAYVAAKHAVTAAFDAVRAELAADGIGVTIVHPTFVTGGMSESARPAGVRRATTGKQITADDVARAVVDGVTTGRDRVLIGGVAHQAWWVNRFAPGLYRRIMLRRLAASHAERRVQA
jgi:NAD(P)-dependent dehydrogenase (short-subunit alcohol dehydrogenase family)